MSQTHEGGPGNGGGAPASLGLLFVAAAVALGTLLGVVALVSYLVMS